MNGEVLYKSYFMSISILVGTKPQKNKVAIVIREKLWKKKSNYELVRRFLRVESS